MVTECASWEVGIALLFLPLLYYSKGRSSHPGSIKNFHLIIPSRPLLRPTQPPIEQALIKGGPETHSNLMTHQTSFKANVRFVETRIAEQSNMNRISQNYEALQF
jgi:hypothetical protein